MNTEKRKLEVDNAFAASPWCTVCVLCTLPPELYVFIATYWGPGVAE